MRVSLIVRVSSGLPSDATMPENERQSLWWALREWRICLTDRWYRESRYNLNKHRAMLRSHNAVQPFEGNHWLT